MEYPLPPGPMGSFNHIPSLVMCGARPPLELLSVLDVELRCGAVYYPCISVAVLETLHYYGLTGGYVKHTPIPEILKRQLPILMKLFLTSLLSSV